MQFIPVSHRLLDQFAGDCHPHGAQITYNCLNVSICQPSRDVRASLARHFAAPERGLVEAGKAVPQRTPEGSVKRSHPREDTRRSVANVIALPYRFMMERGRNDQTLTGFALDIEHDIPQLTRCIGQADR